MSSSALRYSGRLTSAVIAVVMREVLSLIENEPTQKLRAPPEK
jgi:hypothetical protein